jgi:large subunit ribosomal protein L6
MSRIAKYPVVVPKGRRGHSHSGEISVKGPLGTLKQAIHPAVRSSATATLQVQGGAGARMQAPMSGTMRACWPTWFTGVTKGFEKKLTLVGVGYRAQAQGDKLNLTLGFSHPVVHDMPAGIKVETPSQTEIVIKGIDKQVVGQVAAEVRAYRPPEPYKGKGVRYADEVIVLKETKKK